MMYLKHKYYYNFFSSRFISAITGRGRVPSPSLGNEKTSSFLGTSSNGNEASGSDGKSKPRSR